MIENGPKKRNELLYMVRRQLQSKPLKPHTQPKYPLDEIVFESSTDDDVRPYDEIVFESSSDEEVRAYDEIVFESSSDEESLDITDVDPLMVMGIIQSKNAHKIRLLFEDSFPASIDGNAPLATAESIGIGMRSIYVEKLYKENMLNLNGELIPFVTGKVNFAKLHHKVASVGASKREAITLDPNSPALRRLVKEFCDHLDFMKIDLKDPLRNFLHQLIIFIRSKLGSRFDVDNAEDRQFLAKYGEAVSLPTKSGHAMPTTAIDILAFVKDKKGVCRHHGVLMSAMLGLMVRQGILPEFDVHQYRGNCNGGAHTVSVLKAGKQLWYLDSLNSTMPFILGDGATAADKVLMVKHRKFLGKPYIDGVLERFATKKTKPGLRI